MVRREFKEFGKIPRLNRQMVITEKIDGTNGAIVIMPISHINGITNEDGTVTLYDHDQRMLIKRSGDHLVFAQSRSRYIDTEYDNFGFAEWIHNNADALVDTLGSGHHFGEWWGHGIQRGYGLPKGEKRFSLFNTSRWNEENTASVPGLGVVPVLHKGPFDTHVINDKVQWLKENGSLAAPGFMRPEGVIAFHVAGDLMFKVTCEKDEQHKWQS